MLAHSTPEGPLADDPAAPLNCVRPLLGGYADMAALISERSDHVVVRQNVWQWWRRRTQTGFPAGQLVPGKTKQHRVFNADDVIAWWLSYRDRVRWRS